MFLRVVAFQLHTPVLWYHYTDTVNRPFHLKLSKYSDCKINY